MTRNGLLWFISQMLTACLFWQAKTKTRNIRLRQGYGGQAILTTMILAGAALATPHAAQAQGPGCYVADNYLSYPVICLGADASTGKSIGAPSDIPGSPTAGDPVDVASGNVFLHVMDYTTPGQNPLQFIRYYNSMADFSNLSTFTAALGSYTAILYDNQVTAAPLNWRTNYDRYLQISPDPSPTTVIAERADGQQITFTLISSVWTPDTDVDYTLTNSGSTWTLTDHNDTVEVYNDAGSGEGVLQTITLRNGYQQTMSYTAATGCAGGTELCTVTDSYGRSLSLSYTSGLLTSVSTPDSLVVSYGYTSYGALGFYMGSVGNMLTSVSYNTSPTTSQTYAYATTSPWPYEITSITDENGNTAASWTFDAAGRAVSSQQGTGGLDANYTTFSYNTGTTTVTNAYSVADTYNFSTYQNVPKLTEIDRASTGTTAAAHEYFYYDANGYLSEKKDWNTNQTNITNDSHGDPTSIVQAYGSSSPSVSRTTSITYDGTWVHEPDCITTTGNTLAFTYDGSGNVHYRAETDTADGGTACATSSGTYTRVWTNTWGTGANIGLLTSVTDPLSHATSFGYPASGSNTGMLTSITDALSHTTTVNTYTGGGLPTEITDPNGVVTTLAYDARLNLHTRTLDPGALAGGPYVTSYAHDAANRLTQVTLPDSSYLQYGYDAANRLTTITNALGEYISFTLDYLGDRTVSNIYNAGSTLTRKHTATFDALGRILTDLAWTTSMASNTTTYAYDPNGNATSIEDPNGHTTYPYYDALNRVYKIKDRLSNYTYITSDAHDAVTQVTDPNGNDTNYTRDGFERVTQLASPDSGTSNYVYDKANNLTQKTDGASVVTNRTFDAVNREITRTFPGNSAEDVYKTYDQTGGYGYGVGHLTTMTDAGQTLYIGYDERGNDIVELHTLGAYNFVILKSYDAASRINVITTPDGYFAGWGRDAAGQVNWIAYSTPLAPSTPVALVGNGSSTFITHEPFGPAILLPFQNGITRTNTYDLDYKLTNTTDENSTPTAFLNLSYAYDANNNVTGITDSVTAANSQSMTYDYMDRVLTAASGMSGYGSYVWTWDANGNRTSETLNGGTTDTYSYYTNTNKLDTTSYSGFGVSYNGAGAGTAISQYSSSLSCEAWNQSEQMLSETFAPCLTSPAAVIYAYDGFGQRLGKTAAVGTAFLAAVAPSLPHGRALLGAGGRRRDGVFLRAAWQPDGGNQHGRTDHGLHSARSVLAA